MEWISNMDVLIVGLGLMGGSYARALTRLGFHVSAIDTSEDSIAYALEQGIIEKGFAQVDEQVVRNADAVIFALYPGVFIQWIKRYQHLFKPGLMLTDVTGVKASVVYEVQSMLRPDVEFIAAHPMAGREVYGVRNSDDRIFRDANYIVVPTERNTPAGIDWCRALGRLLGFRKISILSPEAHDDMIGFVSQLTHCIAVCLMTCSDNTQLAYYTGDSFRDLTRIARINEDMWCDLFMLNQDRLLKQMDIFLDEMATFRNMLESGDTEALKAKMRLSTQRRAMFDKL